MPVKMIAKAKIRYPFLGPDAKEYEPGDEFEVREVDELAEAKTAEALATAGTAELKPDEPKGKYKRRDLRATED
jgi:hypothetical protein